MASDSLFRSCSILSFTRKEQKKQKEHEYKNVHSTPAKKTRETTYRLEQPCIPVDLFKRIHWVYIVEVPAKQQIDLLEAYDIKTDKRWAGVRKYYEFDKSHQHHLSQGEFLDVGNEATDGIDGIPYIKYRYLVYEGDKENVVATFHMPKPKALITGDGAYVKVYDNAQGLDKNSDIHKVNVSITERLLNTANQFYQHYSKKCAMIFPPYRSCQLCHKDLSSTPANMFTSDLPGIVKGVYRKDAEDGLVPGEHMVIQDIMVNAGATLLVTLEHLFKEQPFYLMTYGGHPRTLPMLRLDLGSRVFGNIHDCWQALEIEAGDFTYGTEHDDFPFWVASLLPKSRLNEYEARKNTLYCCQQLIHENIIGVDTGAEGLWHGIVLSLEKAMEK